jgi:hypothetical protein
MNQGRTVFSQIMDVLPHVEFQECVARYDGDHRVRTFSCHDQFLVMAFAQLTYRESLRDIEVCLRAFGTKLYHMGIRGKISRSTIADANERRDWRIFRDFSMVLMERARCLYAKEPLAVELPHTLYALDSTTIDLSLSLFPWAPSRSTKGAVKLHTLLDLRGSIPAFLLVSTGKMGDVRALDIIIPEPGSFYLVDRAYVDYRRLCAWQCGRAFFVSRARKNSGFARQRSFPISDADKAGGVRADQRVTLTSYHPKRHYPDALRRVCYTDLEKGKKYVFLTNNFTLPALTIANLYRCRWQVELFFKWIKQHLCIKSFYGTSENAVKTQIWTATATYLLIAIVKKDLRLDDDLHTLLNVLSLTLLEKTPVKTALSRERIHLFEERADGQLKLFDL